MLSRPVGELFWALPLAALTLFDYSQVAEHMPIKRQCNSKYKVNTKIVKDEKTQFNESATIPFSSIDFS